MRSNTINLKQITKLLAFALVAFVGGAMSPWILGWIKPNVTPAPSDAIAIANTYIVFTTIIFVGTTLVLAMAGYVFTQQFSKDKATQIDHLFEELRIDFREDDKRAILFVTSVLENPDVRHHLDVKLQSKIDEIIEVRRADAERSMQAVESLSNQLKPNGVNK